MRGRSRPGPGPDPRLRDERLGVVGTARRNDAAASTWVGVGDRHPARPNPVMLGDDAPVGANPHPVQVRGDINEPADHGRVDGVVVRVEADVVVAAETDPVPPAQMQRDRRQRQHAARSASSRSTGAALRSCAPSAAFASSSQSLNWALKSAGEANERPGMNEVSNQPLRRSTMPLDSGSRGGSNTSLVASVPMNAATPSAWRLPRPMPGSLSQISRRGTRPELLDQLPRPQQQILGLAGRDHPARG